MVNILPDFVFNSNKTKNTFYLEPVELIGEGEYNLNDLKEIKVTDSYLGLDEHVRGCQNEKSFHNCTTKHYIDSILKECGCLPFDVRVSDKVCDYAVTIIKYAIFYFFIDTFVFYKWS